MGIEKFFLNLKLNKNFSKNITEKITNKFDFIYIDFNSIICKAIENIERDLNYVNFEIYYNQANNIELFRNEDKILDKLDIDFSTINITSDNFLKNYKLSHVIKDKYVSFNNDLNVCIYDEVDDILNPLTNQLNIVNCDLDTADKDKLIRNIGIISDFMFKLYDLEEENKGLYDEVFNRDEQFYNIVDSIKYNELFKFVIRNLLNDGKYKIIKDTLEISGIELETYINNIISNEKNSDGSYKYFYTQLILSEYSNTLYNLYIKYFILKNSFVLKKQPNIASEMV